MYTQIKQNKSDNSARAYVEYRLIFFQGKIFLFIQRIRDGSSITQNFNGVIQDLCHNGLNGARMSVIYYRENNVRGRWSHLQIFDDGYRSIITRHQDEMSCVKEHTKLIAGIASNTNKGHRSGE